MRALVVSGIPFSHSNRGIDILTQALADDDWDTTHLAFGPRRSLDGYALAEQVDEKVRQDFLFLNPIGYYKKFMDLWPAPVASLLIRASTFGLHYDFSPYDLIVIESGKPTFLEPMIPDDAVVVYRQSDPMSMMFKNPAMHEAEKRMIRRADAILRVRDVPGADWLYGIGDGKDTVIENGFDCSAMRGFSRGVRACTPHRRAAYVGYTPASAELLLALAGAYPSVTIDIVGECLDEDGKRLLAACENVVLHGNLPSGKYLPIVADADVGIVPFSNANYIAGIGMNSKYLMFMYLGLPIVSVDIGCKHEFPPTPYISFCDTTQGFLDAFGRYLNLGRRVSYDVDFDSYSKDGRMKLYQKYFQDLMKSKVSSETRHPPAHQMNSTTA